VKSRFPRAVAAYHNARQALTRGSLETIFTEIHRTNAWRDPESVSGRGSTLARTKIIMSQLPLLLQELQAETLLDAACGDLNWMRYVDLGKVKYTGVDVVPDLIQRNRTLYGELRTFALLDITSDELPQSDVVLCRDCFIHLSYRSIRAALKNFKKTNAKYLLCTTHTTLGENIDCPDGSWRSVNVQLAPLNFPAPLKLIVEDAELGKSLGVWRMADL
jgi:2-polyprenyl-3-methyl-5-hydroxy-6-metoxy-1,4-benzoquinol methylase